MVPLIGDLTLKRTGVVGWAVFCFFAMTEIIDIKDQVKKARLALNRNYQHSS